MVEPSYALPNVFHVKSGRLEIVPRISENVQASIIISRVSVVAASSVNNLWILRETVSKCAGCVRVGRSDSAAKFKQDNCVNVVHINLTVGVKMVLVDVFHHTTKQHQYMLGIKLYLKTDHIMTKGSKDQKYPVSNYVMEVEDLGWGTASSLVYKLPFY